MSVVSSVLSTRSSTGWRINVRFSSLMDNIFAIGFGLALRFVVDTVSHQDFKLTGTLVGLWEGVIMLHFLKKTPKSSDPYIAYGVRLFIDFLFTESLARTVLVLIWTALGMVLADITPAIWEDVGLKRIWKSFRRDLYTISRVIPTVAFFPPARTVRFSPSREPSVIVESTEVLSPSEITQEIHISNNDQPFAPVSRDALKRRLPGYFPLDYSDTDTETGSIRISQYTAPGRTSRRLSVYPQRGDSEDSASDLSLGQEELDDANLSSFPSDATETGEPQSALPDASEIPEMQLDEEPLVVDTTGLPVKPEDGEVTPTQRPPIFMPPTPSDSAPHWGRRRDADEPLPVRPPSEFLPQIPDFLEDTNTEEWDKIQPEDYEKPPTPPAKDKPVGFKIPKVPDMPPPEPPTGEQSHTTPNEEESWDTLDSQVLSRPPPEGHSNEQPDINDDTRRQTLPPSYDDVNFDDIYDDPPRNDIANDFLTGSLIDNDVDIPPTHIQQADAGAGPLHPLSSLGANLINPWAQGTSDTVEATGDSNEAEEAIRAEAARLQEEQERAAEAERERQRQEEEEAEKRKQEEAAREKAQEKERRLQENKAKKAAEKAEREKKEREDEKARKQRVAEAEEAEKKKAEQRKKDAEDARLRREEAAKQKREEEEAEKKRKEEEAEVERKHQEEEAEKKRKQEAEEAEKKRKQEEEEAKKRKQQEDEEEAEKVRKADEEEIQRKEDEEKRLSEEEEQRIVDEAVKKAMEEEEKAKEEQAKGDAEAQAVPEADNGNAGANEANGEQLEGQQTPTMSPRRLDEASKPQEASTALVPDTVEEQSVISDMQPPDPEVRVERMLLLRAQMIDIQSKIEETQLSGSDYSSLEKVLRKMERKAHRRYADGTPQAEYLDDFDGPDTVTLDTLNAQKSRKKVTEKIERFLSPDSHSLSVIINFGKKQADVKKQKPEIIDLLTGFNLLNYCKEGGKKATVNVSEKQFAEWLKGYRILLTQPKNDDDGNALWG